MDEYIIKGKIREAYFEPRAPEELIGKVVLRARAVAMGADAQKQLENSTSVGKIADLTSRVLVGQLAAVSELPKGAQPEWLARQLKQQPAFAEALRGGNVIMRLNSGELLRQIIGQTPKADATSLEKSVRKEEDPTIGGLKK